MAISVETVIYIPAKESGTLAQKQALLDPLPIVEGDCGGHVQINDLVFEIADLRTALDRAERFQTEDAQ